MRALAIKEKIVTNMSKKIKTIMMMRSTTIMISDKEQNYDDIDNGEEAPGSDIGSCHL